MAYAEAENTVYKIRQQDFNSHKRCKDTKLMHRFYLPRRLWDVVLEQDLATLYYTSLCTKNIENWFAKLADGCVIEYRKQSMHKLISTTTAKACVRAIRKYERDKYRPLSRKEQVSVLDLNDRLRQEEAFILDKAMTAYNRLVEEGWQNKGRDFEIDLDIMFFLRPDNPAYEEDDENLVFHMEFEPLKLTLKDMLSGVHDFGVGDRCDHRSQEDLILGKGQVYKVEHCYLFHELLHTYRIPLPLIAHIGDYRVEIKILQQWGLQGEEP